MIKKIFIITFAFLTFSCFGMQDKIDQQKLTLIKEKGLRWYLISKINWQEQNEQRNFPELLCDLIAAYADNQQPLTDEMKDWLKDWLIENIEIPFKELSGHTDWISALTYNPHKQNELASGSFDKTIRIWNTNTGEEIKKLTHKYSVYALTFNPHNPDEAAAGGADDCGISIWNISSNRIKQLADSTSFCSLAYNPHKLNEIAGGSVDGTIRIWDTDTDEEIKRLTGHVGWVNTLAYNPNKLNELASDSTYSIHVWNTNTGEEIKKLTHECSVYALAYNPHNPNELASGSYDKTIHIWNTDTGEEIKKLTGSHRELVKALVYNPHKPNELASGSFQMIHLWNDDTGKEIKKFTGHENIVYELAYNPHNPDELASRSVDNTIRIWNLTNLRKAQRICVNPSMEEAKLIAKIYKAAQEKKKCELNEEEEKVINNKIFDAVKELLILREKLIE